MDKLTIKLINQIFDIERKVVAGNVDALERNIDRIKHDLSEAGIRFIDPTGEPYTDTRTDCDASIIGEASKNLVITKTVKPIIIHEGIDGLELIQKATVIVEGK